MNTIIRLRLESKSDLTIYSTDMSVHGTSIIKKTPIKLIGTMQLPLDVSIHS